MTGNIARCTVFVKDGPGTQDDGGGAMPRTPEPGTTAPDATEPGTTPGPQDRARTARRRPGPRRVFSEAEIVGAALALLDRGGAAALSVRGVAAEIGVAPNALYTYFPDKAALLRAVADQLLGEVELGPRDHASAGTPSPDVDWRDRVRALAVDLRTVLLRHPGAVPLLLGAPMDGPAALALGEELLAVLASAGLPPAQAARASYLLVTYVFGSLALDVAELDPAAPVPSEDDRVRTRRSGFDQVPADAFPLTAAAAPTMARYVTTEQYLWGLDRLLDGLGVLPAVGRPR